MPSNQHISSLFQKPLSSSAVEQVLLSGVGHTELGEMEGDGFLHWQSVHIPTVQRTAQLKFDVSSVVSRGKPPTKTTLRTLKSDINLFPQRPCDSFRQATQTLQLDFPCLKKGLRQCTSVYRVQNRSWSCKSSRIILRTTVMLPYSYITGGILFVCFIPQHIIVPAAMTTNRTYLPIRS